MDGIISVITQSAAQEMRAAKNRVIKAEDRAKQSLIFTLVALIGIPIMGTLLSVILGFVMTGLVILGLVSMGMSLSRADRARRELPEIWDDNRVRAVEENVMRPMAAAVKFGENDAKVSYREPTFVDVYVAPPKAVEHPRPRPHKDTFNCECETEKLRREYLKACGYEDWYHKKYT